MAIGLATHPEVILLDEPFSGIDPIAVNECQEIIKDLRSKGLGILLTDHNVRETLTITDPVTPMSVGLAWHRERAFTPAMQAFRDYFHDAFLAPQQLSARR